MVGPVVVTTTAPKEKTTMTKVEDRTVLKLAKEALLADREASRSYSVTYCRKCSKPR